MRPTIEELKSPNYFLLHKVDHREFNTFSDNLAWKNLYLKMAYWSLLSAFVLATTLLIFQIEASILTKLLWTTLGFFTAIVLVLPHEFLHFLSYKYFGAQDVKINFYLSKTYVLTKADQFVVGKREIFWIALIPFMVITIIGLCFFITAGENWQIAISTSLLFHTSICQADFRMVDFCFDKDGNVFHFDDLKKNATYFYRIR
ncbi:MAG: DUF3267 domain-containing protein [Bacteroidota bacterium]